VGNICLECLCEFEPYQPQHVFCPACFRRLRMQWDYRSWRYPNGDAPRISNQKGWNNYWDWRVFGLAPHLNFQEWTNEFEVEFEWLCWRDEIEK
jgi:hypothetical protein